MKRIYALGVTAILLGGCGARYKEAEAHYSDEKVAVDLVAPPNALKAEIATTSSSASTSAAPEGVQMAYEYSYTFGATAAGVDALAVADQATCARAGIECQMISLSANNYGDSGRSQKTLTLRVTPAWLKTWQAGLAANLRTQDGRISQQSVTSEDLTLQIVDLDAHLKNQLALRDRLLEIIRTHPGKVSELVEAETQLSQVQGDIDSGQSSLATMRKRVATSLLTLTYESDYNGAAPNAFAPVVDAGRNVLATMMTVLGLMITVCAALIPLSFVIVPVGWVIRRWLKARKARKAAALKP